MTAKAGRQGKCKTCMHRNRTENTCKKCKQTKGSSEFSAKQLKTNQTVVSAWRVSKRTQRRSVRSASNQTNRRSSHQSNSNKTQTIVGACSVIRGVRRPRGSVLFAKSRDQTATSHNGWTDGRTKLKPTARYDATIAMESKRFLNESKIVQT